jgi:hypothetical protein
VTFAGDTLARRQDRREKVCSLNPSQRKDPATQHFTAVRLIGGCPHLHGRMVHGAYRAAQKFLAINRLVSICHVVEQRDFFEVGENMIVHVIDLLN